MLKQVFPCLIFLAVGFCAGAAAQQNAEPQAKPKTAGEMFKNVQVFKDLSEDKFWATMSFFTDSLGVSCEHCHDDPYDADTARKRKSRQMIAMVADLNGHYFKGETEVTCNSCHRGAAKPEAEPALSAEHWMGFGRKEHALPDGAELIARFRKLTGVAEQPADHRERIAYEETTYLSEVAPRHENVELVIGGSDKAKMTMRDASGEIVDIRNGKEGWRNVGKDWIPIDGNQREHVASESEAFGWVTLDGLSAPKTIAEDVVRGRDAYVVEAHDGDERVWLDFDQQTGVLLRRRAFFETAYADGSWDMEYGDYRKVGRLMLPYLVQRLNPAGNGLTIRKVSERRLVSADIGKMFEKPVMAQ